MESKGMTLEYFEFDYNDKRHHTLEIPVPLAIRLARLFRVSQCKMFVCDDDDHGEVFCKRHARVEYNAEKEVRAWVHQVIKEPRDSV